MSRVLIWDLPTREFHGVFAAGFAIAAYIALVIGDDGPLFPYHAIIGLVLTLMLVLRLVWGIFGSRYARFGSFAFSPKTVARYLIETVTGAGKRYIGRNPGSAYATFAMFLIMLGIAITGVMLGRGNEGVEDLHETLVYSMIVVAGIHVLGLTWHTIRHRENIAASMVHGRQSGPESAGISTSHAFAAAVFVLIGAAWTTMLVARYDATTGSTTIPVLGALQLGEAEEGRGEHLDGDHRHDHDDD